LPLILPQGKEFDIEQVYFVELINIISSIGGTSSVIAAFFLGLNVVIGYQQWHESIYKEILTSDNKVEIEEKNKVMSKLVTRVSFKGIYKLHDHVDWVVD
jgi:hypothetical protein